MSPRNSKTFNTQKLEDLRTNLGIESQNIQSIPTTISGERRFVIVVVALVVLVMGLAYMWFNRPREISKPAVVNSIQASVPKIDTKGESSESDKLLQPAQLQITSVTDTTTAQIIEKVFKHVFLPSGNVKVASIVKLDELKKSNPIFYQFAREGDRVLIYSDRAILYDPEIDKVLDIAHFK